MHSTSPQCKKIINIERFNVPVCWSKSTEGRFPNMLIPPPIFTVRKVLRIPYRYDESLKIKIKMSFDNNYNEILLSILYVLWGCWKKGIISFKYCRYTETYFIYSRFKINHKTKRSWWNENENEEYQISYVMLAVSVYIVMSKFFFV